MSAANPWRARRHCHPSASAAKLTPVLRCWRLGCLRRRELRRNQRCRNACHPPRGPGVDASSATTASCATSGGVRLATLATSATVASPVASPSPPHVGTRYSPILYALAAFQPPRRPATRIASARRARASGSRRRPAGRALVQRPPPRTVRRALVRRAARLNAPPRHDGRRQMIGAKDKTRRHGRREARPEQHDSWRSRSRRRGLRIRPPSLRTQADRVRWLCTKANERSTYASSAASWESAEPEHFQTGIWAAHRPQSGSATSRPLPDDISF